MSRFNESSTFDEYWLNSRYCLGSTNVNFMAGFYKERNKIIKETNNKENKGLDTSNVDVHN